MHAELGVTFSLTLSGKAECSHLPCLVWVQADQVPLPSLHQVRLGYCLGASLVSPCTGVGPRRLVCTTGSLRQNSSGVNQILPPASPKGKLDQVNTTICLTLLAQVLSGPTSSTCPALHRALVGQAPFLQSLRQDRLMPSITEPKNGRATISIL